eukprot:CFRG7087T1
MKLFYKFVALFALSALAHSQEVNGNGNSALIDTEGNPVFNGAGSPIFVDDEDALTLLDGSPILVDGLPVYVNEDGYFFNELGDPVDLVLQADYQMEGNYGYGSPSPSPSPEGDYGYGTPSSSPNPSPSPSYIDFSTSEISSPSMSEEPDYETSSSYPSATADPSASDSSPSASPSVSPSPSMSVSPSPSASASQTPSSSPSPSPVNDDITCDASRSEGGLVCGRNQYIIEDKECCRFDTCEDLERCSVQTCCKDVPASATPSPSPSRSPAPTPANESITCDIKESEGGLRCTSAGVHEEKECCRVYGKCSSLAHCTNDYCCKTEPSPLPSPSSVPKADDDDDDDDDDDGYEPVNHCINCITKWYEGGYQCSSQEYIDVEKSCCRWSQNCGSLPKCTESYCCEKKNSQTSATPKPSPSPEPIDYTIQCEDKWGLQCNEGYEKNYGTVCCRYRDECGSLPACDKETCCSQKPDSTPKPVLPEDTVNACNCDGVILNRECYSSLQEAANNTVDGDTIFIAGYYYVEETVQFNTSLRFTGVTCGGGDVERAVLVADFDSPTGAILEATNPEEQVVRIEYLAITTNEEKQGAAFHGLGNVTHSGDQKLELTLVNVIMYDMMSTRPGVGVFVGQSSGLYVDADCVFDNLTMSTNETGRYAGGAAIAVIYLPFEREIIIDGYFSNNTAFYPNASLHSGGGAIYFDYMEGNIYLSAEFVQNRANQGGAVNVQGVLGNMIIDGFYRENEAIDDGYGSRAGAVRILQLFEQSYVKMNGSFVGNVAQGRGGVVATNMHDYGSVLEFDGVFQSNVATTVGGVLSRWSNSPYNGTVILEGGCVFEGNTALRDLGLSNIYDFNGERSDTYSEAEWSERDGTLYVI